MNTLSLAASDRPHSSPVSIPCRAFRVMADPGQLIRCAAVGLALALPVVTAGADLVSAPNASGPAAVSAAEEKQRVPKPPPEQPKTKKPEQSGTTEGSSSSGTDSDGDFATSCLEGCLAGCLEGFFDAVFTSLFSRDEAAPALADSALAFAADSIGGADSSWVEAPYEPHAWARLDVGYLRAYAPGDSVVLRRSASDPDSMMLEAGLLPDGARVLVTDTHVDASGSMVQVRAVDSQGPAGWVHEKSIRQEPHSSAAQAAVLAADSTQAAAAEPLATAPADSLAGAGPAARSAGPPRWAMTYSAGVTWIDNPELAKEYKYGGPVFEAEYLRCFRPAWVLGAGLGYRELAGYPSVEYEGLTEIDVPSESCFEMPYAMVEFGLRHAWPSGFRLGYMAGPVVAHVHEEADIVVLDAVTRDPIGSRKESLNRWTWGGGGVVWMGWALPPPYELALRFRIFGLAWDGRHEKSLTSDYTDESLLHYDFALTFTHTGR